MRTQDIVFLPIYQAWILAIAFIVLSAAAAWLFVAGRQNRHQNRVSGAVLDGLQDPVIVVSADLKMQEINDAAAELLKIDVGEARGQSVLPLFGEGGAGTVTELLNSDHPESSEMSLKVHRRTVSVELCTSHLSDHDGTTLGHILVLRPISSQSNSIGPEPASEQAKLRSSIESLSAGFMIADQLGNITLRNAAANSILGVSPKAPLNFRDLEERLKDPDIIASLHKAGERDQIIDMRELSYGDKILHVYAAPLMSQENKRKVRIGTVVLVEDVTEEKILDRSRDEFFSIASHELRTPLTAIRGNANMIIDYYSKVLNDQTLREMIEDIHGSSIRLIDIVNDFLDVSRIEQGKIKIIYEPIALDKVIENVVYEMRIVIQEKKLYLKFDRMTLNDLPYVWGDRNRVKQIIYNLVGNAAKFTDTGGITISVKPGPKFLKVLISDTGHGISPGQQETLFRKFQQGTTSLLTRDTTRGTGLGLYISKLLVEKMGGTIALEQSIMGKGSTFSFTIPVVQDQLATPPKPKSSN